MPDIFVAPKNQPLGPRVQPSVHHPKHHLIGPLSAYAEHPMGLHFQTQGKEERIELFLRRHFITNVPWIVLSILLFLFPVLFFQNLAKIVPFSITPTVGVFLISFWYLAVFGMIILPSFINWYFNVYIVTNERVIDVDFINLLYREISATRLNLIQDVTVKTGGVIRAIFHYGDVFIQTAGTEVNFDFQAVPKPEFVANTIEQLMRQARQKEGVSTLEEGLRK